MTGLDIAAFCRSISTQHGQWVEEGLPTAHVLDLVQNQKNWQLV